jgi:hypothetical protein
MFVLLSMALFLWHFFWEFTRPKGTEILWEFTAGNLLEPAVMLNTTDEQHTLSQPFFWNLQDQKVRYHSLPDAGQTRHMARRGSNMPPHEKKYRMQDKGSEAKTG